MSSKKKYEKPSSINIPQQIETAGVAGAVNGAARMVGRAVAKAVKGGIDLPAGTQGKPIQDRKR